MARLFCMTLLTKITRIASDFCLEKEFVYKTQTDRVARLCYGFADIKLSIAMSSCRCG